MKEITISKKQLLDCLLRLRKGFGVKVAIPILNDYKFEIEGSKMSVSVLGEETWMTESFTSTCHLKDWNCAHPTVTSWYASENSLSVATRRISSFRARPSMCFLTCCPGLATWDSLLRRKSHTKRTGFVKTRFVRKPSLTLCLQDG